MSSTRAIVVRPDEGHRVGNVEFLARTTDSPRFNSRSSHRNGPEMHAHDAEDDAFYILDGELVFTVDGEEIVARAGTFVLVWPGVPHTFANRAGFATRFANVPAPAGFDLRLAEG